MPPLPLPDPRVVHRRVGGDVVLVHLETNQIFALNSTGARFWELLSENSDRGQIEQTMLGEFAVEPDELRREIDGLLQSLSHEHLVLAP